MVVLQSNDAFHFFAMSTSIFLWEKLNDRTHKRRKSTNVLYLLDLFTVAIGLNFHFSFIYFKNIKSPPTFYRV